MNATAAPIRAITFDFWRTLFDAHTGLKERRLARVEAVAAITGAERAAVKDALKLTDGEFLRVHIIEQRTLEPGDAIPMLEHRLGVALSTQDGHALADALADSGLAHPPGPIAGALEAVRAAAAKVPVGIVSDTGIIPGSRLRGILDAEGFLEHFSSLSFSDEVGVAKPQAGMFEDAARQLKVEPGSLIHIGDLEPTDVVGAKNVGARSALFSGDNDRYAEQSQADYVFDSWSTFVEELPRILD